MPPKSKVPVGELTSAQIRKLIRAHNTLVKQNLIIKIPAGTTREGLIKLVEDKGYTIRHGAKKIEAIFDSAPYDYISLDQVDEILKKPAQTALQKQKAAEAKAAKAEKKKKEERVIRKKATEAEKARTKPTVAKATPKPKPKAKPKPKKEDEVRPKEKVGRPKVDPKKIKVIQPKPKPAPKPKEAPKPKPAPKKFTTLDQVKNSFNKILSNFKKEHVDKFIDSLPNMNDKKEINDENKELRKKGKEMVFVILKNNEELFEELDPDEEVYDELETKYESVINLANTAAVARVKQLKKDE